MRITFSIAALELTIARRNLWLAIAVAMMIGFSLVLTVSGTAIAGPTGGGRLAVAVASMTTLLVYLVPLIGLLLSFDAIAGERERGTLPLLFCQPIRRGQLLTGKFIAHLLILSLAVALGLAVMLAVVTLKNGGTPPGPAGLAALANLLASAVLLGATFIALGYLVSCATRQSTSAAGIAIAVWVTVIILYDLALLGGLVVDDGGTFTKQIFPWLLLANPADAFRTFNLHGIGEATLASGLVAGPGIARWMSVLALTLGPVVGLGLTWSALRRMEA